MTLPLLPEPHRAPPRLRLDDERFVVASRQSTLFEYVHGGAARAPHIPVVCGPSGRNMLEPYPADRRHHRGIWWGHGAVNGNDIYTDSSGSGRVEHRRWLEVIDRTPIFGFTAVLAWKGHDDRVLLTECRQVRVEIRLGPEPTVGPCQTIDLISTYRAERALHFESTKEAALPGIRLAEPLTERAGGRLEAADGSVGADEVFGRPVGWIDCSGKRMTIHGSPMAIAEGIACLVHPESDFQPTRFFARSYGVVSPAPGHLFTGPASVGPGGGYRTFHRLVVHRGRARSAHVAAEFRRLCAIRPGWLYG